MPPADSSSSSAIARADARTLLLEHEEALKATRQNLVAIYEASGDGLALCEAIFDDDGQVVDYQVLEVNQAHADLTAASREAMLTQRVSGIYPPVDPRWYRTAQTVLQTGAMQDFDIRSRATGRWLNVRVSRVSDSLFQQTFVDVTDRHLLEEQRKTLLMEMSHRVMNNFQMVASFLHVQAKNADPIVREPLLAAEGRVYVLAKLHSMLSSVDSDVGGEVDGGAYVSELCANLATTIERPNAITLSCETSSIMISADTIVPLGFIISELVTNSIKYAYPEPRSGPITVRLSSDGDAWMLEVGDAGVGMSPDAGPIGGGLGSRLVSLFVKQIGATLETTSDRGVRHQLSFVRAEPPAGAV